jgi:tryptophan-rich sensory protein
MAKRILIFLVLNFVALGLGGLATSSGVASDWYQQLRKAPLTPPGWVFGFAWSTIMICYAVYMAVLWNRVNDRKRWMTWFALQWVLNVSWNPVFFAWHQVNAGLVIITLLLGLIAWFTLGCARRMGWWTLLILPYLIWLVIATSLNAYIAWFNA